MSATGQNDGVRIFIRPYCVTRKVFNLTIFMWLYLVALAGGVLVFTCQITLVRTEGVFWETSMHRQRDCNRGLCSNALRRMAALSPIMLRSKTQKLTAF